MDISDTMEEDELSFETAQETPRLRLDCYPYTFTPLLLFTTNGYFDKGYSNYHSVAAFFESVIPVDMLDNVLCDRKNMLYEDLLAFITDHEMLVTCCIDAHFTAFCVLGSNKKKPCLLYYDPCSATCKIATGESFKTLALYFLLKCGYGDSQHIQENKDYYTGVSANATRRTIYSLWKKIHQVSNIRQLYQVKMQPVSLNLASYLLVNDKRNYSRMSTQLTGNTCYFQTFLFAVLCKVGRPTLNRDGKSIDFANIGQLRDTTVNMSRFLLTFFVDSREGVMRPLTNPNFVVDFDRYHGSPYFPLVSNYLQGQGENVPQYQEQYQQVMQYFQQTKVLHKFQKFTLEGAVASSPNTKQLQAVYSTEDAERKLAMHDYYKYRATNLMFGFHAGIIKTLESFCEFNALRKNQLLGFYDQLENALSGTAEALAATSNKYRDYYFIPQFEIGQQQLVNVHHYLYLLDHHALVDVDQDLVDRVHAVNDVLVNHTLFSTQKSTSYDKILPLKDFKKSKKSLLYFKNAFMTVDFLTKYIGLGFPEVNPKEKEVNALTQTVFYLYDLMRTQANRQSYEFEKECINQMARSNNRPYMRRFDAGEDAGQAYKVGIAIGVGHTFSKYNTLIHALTVIEKYWHNTDLSNIQVLGKDVRTLLAISCQKIFFDDNHCGYYYYGPFEISRSAYREELDLSVATSIETVVPSVSSDKRSGENHLIITDRVFSYSHVQAILEGLFSRAEGVRFKPDNEVLNLLLLSLMLDFGLYERFVELLNIPFLQHLQHMDTRELQVEVANLIYEFDRKNTSDPVTRSQVEELIFEMSYKFLVNKDMNVQSRQFKLIRVLNGDPDYQSYVLLCKIYMSLCQINKSVEVDYYKVQCDGSFVIIIPKNFSKGTSGYLEEVTRQYTFSEKDGIMVYDDLPVFDLRPQQPEINLYKIRFDSATDVQSYVKYIEISNAFHVLGSEERYLVFIADNALLVDASGEKGAVIIRINKIDVEVATVYFNEAISFIPCFKYAESEDVVLFCSAKNIRYMVDKGGQFHNDYYGMKNELIESINSVESIVDLNDEHIFKSFKLSELLTESKTVIHFPDYVLQVSDRQQLINLLDLAIHVRNVSFFVLVLFYLRRSSIRLAYIEKERDVVKISGPWRHAILYALGKGESNPNYDAVFEKQFFDLNQHEDMPIEEFIDVLAANFTKYQRWTEDGEYEISPRPKQKEFLKRIICSETPMHFSEVGSGKTKVIMPLLCQAFLSNNVEVHKALARGGSAKDALVILVPEHLVADARTQVFRYCLNLNFRDDYRVYDDIFALLHDEVKLGSSTKQIFVTSFNQFKKSLTVDSICKKVYPNRGRILVVADEVDDFLDRNKLVFNICSNKANSFERSTLDLFFDSCEAAYRGEDCESAVVGSANPEYWKQLNSKFKAIHSEIQDASKSINKSFGIFNEQTLRHCSTDIAHDVEGYKSLIARPYESVNRAMPGSYYSDVERTIFLTYVILFEDIAKYNDLFQAERKFISFEYHQQYFVHQLDFDDVVYGHETLSEIVAKHPETRDGLSRYLFEIILRRMEIRDQSRSVNSIDVVFNFDCIGFTGTPFLDNYPSFDYIRSNRQDDIPGLIDRSFYAYSSDTLTTDEFEERFASFQGQNSHVDVAYVGSDFIRDTNDEMSILESVFSREEQRGSANFNCIVDLCGIFKLSTIYDVRIALKKHFGERFQYLYHIDPATSGDRVLSLSLEKNDVQFDEDFYRYLCKTYGASLRDRIFFFVDNRNVIGKDVPFQLAYQRHFGQPLITTSIVLAHDIDDFSKIWQAMGRSRTMNATKFSVYKSDIPLDLVEDTTGAFDVKKQALTRQLYVHNCDRKMAGNISSCYLTLVSLFNLSQRSFYYRDEIVNTFLEKMENTILDKVMKQEDSIALQVLGNAVPAQILQHMLKDKFRRSSNLAVAQTEVTEEVVEALLRQVIRQKFEQRARSNDIYDELVTFLSGEQRSLMEISYTKQQQKQKQKQQNKNQDSDAVGIFEKENQLKLSFRTQNYYEYSRTVDSDVTKVALNLPSSIPILTVTYEAGNVRHEINLYPTLQFLYSHHIRGAYICENVQAIFKQISTDTSGFYSRFLNEIEAQERHGMVDAAPDSTPSEGGISIKVLVNFVRQNPQYTIAGLRKGAYLIGMREQFTSHSVESHPLCDRIQYISDDMGFILFDKTNSKSVDSFGPYFIEQYILLEVLSKHEVAQNVIDYYLNNRETLQRGLDSYDERQGKGFVCWRFLMNETATAIAAAAKRDSPENDEQNEHDLSTPKRRRGKEDEDVVLADGLAKTLDI